MVARFREQITFSGPENRMPIIFKIPTKIPFMPGALLDCTILARRVEERRDARKRLKGRRLGTIQRWTDATGREPEHNLL